jgi:hypothetical protein
MYKAVAPRPNGLWLGRLETNHAVTGGMVVIFPHGQTCPRNNGETSTFHLRHTVNLLQSFLIEPTSYSVAEQRWLERASPLLVDLSPEKKAYILSVRRKELIPNFMSGSFTFNFNTKVEYTKCLKN